MITPEDRHLQYSKDQVRSIVVVVKQRVVMRIVRMKKPHSHG